MARETLQQTTQQSTETDDAVLFDGSSTELESSLAQALIEGRGGVTVAVPESLFIPSGELRSVRRAGKQAIISYVESDRAQNGGRPYTSFYHRPY